METIENEFWSDVRPYYMLYQDKYFLKSIYAQIFSDFPDVGQISYIGTSTKKLSKDYSVNGEESVQKDFNKNNEKNNNDINQNFKKDNRKKAGINVCDASEESEIREYANIKEIKEMNNMLFYKQMLRDIVIECTSKKIKNICHLKGNICMYDKFKEGEDIFVRLKNNCIWLKKEYMETTAVNMTSILGEVHVIGFVIESSNDIKVIKAIAMYIN